MLAVSIVACASTSYGGRNGPDLHPVWFSGKKSPFKRGRIPCTNTWLMCNLYMYGSLITMQLCICINIKHQYTMVAGVTVCMSLALWNHIIIKFLNLALTFKSSTFYFEFAFNILYCSASGLTPPGPHQGRPGTCWDLVPFILGNDSWSLVDQRPCIVVRILHLSGRSL